MCLQCFGCCLLGWRRDRSMLRGWSAQTGVHPDVHTQGANLSLPGECVCGRDDRRGFRWERWVRQWSKNMQIFCLGMLRQLALPTEWRETSVLFSIVRELFRDWKQWRRKASGADLLDNHRWRQSGRPFYDASYAPGWDEESKRWSVATRSTEGNPRSGLQCWRQRKR